MSAIVTLPVPQFMADQGLALATPQNQSAQYSIMGDTMQVRMISDVFICNHLY